MKFTCEIKRIKSMADNTYDVTLNMPEYEMVSVIALMHRLKDSPIIELEMVEEEQDEGTWRNE